MDTVIDYLKCGCPKMIKFYIAQGLIEAMAGTGAISHKTAWTRQQVDEFCFKWLNEALRLLKEEGKDVG